MRPRKKTPPSQRGNRCKGKHAWETSDCRRSTRAHSRQTRQHSAMNEAKRQEEYKSRNVETRSKSSKRKQVKKVHSSSHAKVSKSSKQITSPEFTSKTVSTSTSLRRTAMTRNIQEETKGHKEGKTTTTSTFQSL